MNDSECLGVQSAAGVGVESSRVPCALLWCANTEHICTAGIVWSGDPADITDWVAANGVGLVETVEGV